MVNRIISVDCARFRGPYNQLYLTAAFVCSSQRYKDEPLGFGCLLHVVCTEQSERQIKINKFCQHRQNY